MTTLYTSAEHFDHEKLMQILLNHRILCNVTPIQSIAQRADTGDCFIETGAKVDIFDITPDSFITLWASMRDHLHIHCVWLEHDDYAGCIVNWAPYQQRCASSIMVKSKPYPRAKAEACIRKAASGYLAYTLAGALAALDIA